jgi:hypothetical protein
VNPAPWVPAQLGVFIMDIIKCLDKVLNDFDSKYGLYMDTSLQKGMIWLVRNDLVGIEGTIERWRRNDEKEKRRKKKSSR